MASIEKYDMDIDVLYQLNHDFRSSPKPPRNTEIVPELTKNNYFLSPENHGRSAKACMNYYRELLNNSYIFGKNSDRNIVRCLQWAIQAPSDLAPEKKRDFFEACYEYLNNIYGEQNCVAAVVHTDEIMKDKHNNRISKDHLHYLTVPRIANEKYLSKENKFKEGISKLYDLGLATEKEKVQQIFSSIKQFYSKDLSKNETIRKLTKELGCKYEEARRIYNCVVVKDSQAYKMKLKAKTSRKQLHEFHPGLQKFLEERGIHCTVSFKSQGLEREASFTVAEAKTVTRVTGLSVEEIKDLEVENEKLHEQVTMLSKEIENTKEHEKTSGWGDTSDWGKNRGTKEWEREY